MLIDTFPAAGVAARAAAFCAKLSEPVETEPMEPHEEWWEDDGKPCSHPMSYREGVNCHLCHDTGIIQRISAEEARDYDDP